MSESKSQEDIANELGIILSLTTNTCYDKLSSVMIIVDRSVMTTDCNYDNGFGKNS